MLYERIGTGHEFSWDEEVKNAKYVGVTTGCGCCSYRDVLTVEKVTEYIQELEEKLAEANSILEELS